MCIYIRYNMSIIEKAFHCEENEITVIKCRDNIWFSGKDTAKALGYSIPRKAIHEHVDHVKQFVNMKMGTSLFQNLGLTDHFKYLR